MEKIYLKQLVGSRFFGINLEGSDTDVIVIWDNPSKNKPGRPHYMYKSVDDGIKEILGIENNFYQIVDGLGEDYIHNDFTKYLEENIEWIKSKNIGFSYENFQQRNEYEKHIIKDICAIRYSKRIVHLILYKKIFIDYANGKKLRESLKIEPQFASFLQAARRGEIPIKELLDLNSKLNGNFQKNSFFYKEKKDLEFANKEKEKMKAIINNIIVEQQYQEDK